MTYKGTQQKESLHSIGLNLINGIVCMQMMERLSERSFSTTISDLCYTVSPLISLQSGFKRVEQLLFSMLENETHEWAITSAAMLEEEVAMIRHFYGQDTNKLQFEQELKSAYERLQPR